MPQTERGEQETYCSSCPSQLRTLGYQFFTCGFRSTVPYVRLFFATGESSSAPGRAAPPAGTVAPADPEPSLLPGTAAATPLQGEDSPCGLFGAFGVSLMATSGAAPPAVDDDLSPSCVTVTVDGGSSSHFFDPFLMPRWRSRMSDYAVLDQPHRIHGVGGHILEGIGTGTIYSTVLDIHKLQVPVHFQIS